jgi:hypothetical protein
MRKLDVSELREFSLDFFPLVWYPSSYSNKGGAR